MPPKIKIKHLKDFKKPLHIQYGCVETKFGDVQLGVLDKAVVFLYFSPRLQLNSNIETLKKKWSGATWEENTQAVQDLAHNIFENEEFQTEVILNGTDFQKNVWSKLIDIPKGEQWTYTDCAKYVCKPTAVRAVASAIASNEISYIIPCHRVVSKNGDKFKYGWGAQIKKDLLSYEAGNKI